MNTVQHKSKHIVLALLLAASGFVAASSGCKKEIALAPPPPPKVTVASPVTRDVAESIEFTGTTKARATVDLRARVNGYLEKINFKDGADVEKDAVLFVLEQAPFKIALQSSEANLKKAQASLALADANIKRTTQLLKNNVATQQAYDVEEAERARAAAEVDSALTAVEQAKLDLSYTEIRAPLKGRIGRHLVDLGNLVRAEDTLLATIESINPIDVYFHVSERDMLRIMDLMRDNTLPDPAKNPPEILMGLQNEKGFPRKGKLEYRELGVDPGTGTVLRRAIFDNEDESLVPGLFVRLRGTLGAEKPRVLVEERAIASDQRGDYLLSVNDKNVVQYRPVTLGALYDGLRVIETGIAATDTIIVNGLQRARPGKEVNPERETKPGATKPESQVAKAEPVTPATSRPASK